MRRVGWVLAGCLAVTPAFAAEPAAPTTLPPLPEVPPVAPETPATYEKLSLTEAVRRALTRNPTALIAAQEIKRAEALLIEARAGSLPSLTAHAALTRLDADRVFPGRAAPIAAKNQQSANLLLTVPLLAPRPWMQWAQSSEALATTTAVSADVRRTLAVATARAYLAIIAQKRQVDINARSVAVDRSHYEFTHTRFAGGIGRRMDEVRAAQQLAAHQAQLSASLSTLARAREALGVLLAENQPVDTLDDVTLPTGDSNFQEATGRRADLLAAQARTRTAEKIRKDSWADYAPSINGQFQPFYQHPSTLTQPETGWQAMLVLSFPLIEGGLRRGQLRERDALLAQARAQYDGLLRQTRSELRVASEEIRRADEAMRSAKAAAELAHQALELANLAYQAGATTNLEVIDAERSARDADTAAVIAEDNVRQARLNLLVAAGQFPPGP